MTTDEMEAAISNLSSWLAFLMHRYDHCRWEPEVVLAWCSFRESNRDVLISLALRGWQPAHALLCDMAALLTAIGDPLPRWLQEYVVVAARAGPACANRGQHPFDNHIRDWAIATLIASACNQYRLRPTRNPTKTNKESGCSITKKALEHLGIHMSEANVAAIWQAQGRLDRADTRRRYAPEAQIL
jgi:hypothetical protein